MTKPLRTTAAQTLLTQTLQNLETIKTHFPTAYELAQDYRPGYPAGGTGGGSRPSGHGDPTPARATRPEPDPRRELSDQLREAHAIFTRLAVQVQTLATRTPTAKPEPECAQCALLGLTANVYATIRTDDKRIPACSWHYDFWQAHEQWPHPALVRHHAAGHHTDSARGRALMRDHHPDIYETLTKGTR